MEYLLAGEPVNPADMGPSEKTAWGLAIIGYATAAVRYIFGAGTLKQRLQVVEEQVKSHGTKLDEVAQGVAYIRGQLDKMNGKGH